MNSILQDLYYGNFFPAERFQPLIKKHKDILEVHNKDFENFKKKLEQVEPPLVSEFVKLYNEMYREIPFENTEAFICGFRTGARMMLEVMEEEH